MPNNNDSVLNIRIPFELKVWLAHYARLRRESMTDVLIALIQGLQEAEEQAQQPEGA